MAQYGYYYTKEEMDEIAEKYGWTLVSWQENIYMVSYKKKLSSGVIARINVYLTTMTVGTALEHPKKGKTQLFRNVRYEDKILKGIFKNPRVHTDKGYFKRENKPTLF